MTQNERDALAAFDAAALTAANEALSPAGDAALEAAADLIDAALERGGRLHVAGIGKPGHLAGYIASLLASTGTPTYELNGTEAYHGSSGQVAEGDAAICISNSGTTAELLAAAGAIKNNGAVIIAVTGDPDSPLARMSSLHLCARVGAEGGPLGRAPRASILAECLVLQRLSVLLQVRRGQTVDDYIRCHPGGQLGKR